MFQLVVGRIGCIRSRNDDNPNIAPQLLLVLAQNLAQSELARKQAATIRTMKREGIERGGYGTPWRSFMRPLRRLWTRRDRSEAALDPV